LTDGRKLRFGKRKNDKMKRIKEEIFHSIGFLAFELILIYFTLSVPFIKTGAEWILFFFTVNIPFAFWEEREQSKIVEL
jgi:hypothetical protein